MASSTVPVMTSEDEDEDEEEDEDEDEDEEDESCMRADSEEEVFMGESRRRW